MGVAERPEPDSKFIAYFSAFPAQKVCLTCSTLALQELSVASRLRSSFGTYFCNDFTSSEVDSQKAQGHIFLTDGRAISGWASALLLPGHGIP